MLKKHQTYFEVILILLFGLVSQVWFKKNYLLIGVDTFLPLNLDNFLNEYFYIWSWKTAFGFADVVKLPFLFPLGILLKTYALSRLPFSILIFQRLLTYFLFAGSGLSVYFLFRTSFTRSSSFSRLISALLYMFNFYTMFIFFALPYPLLFSYAFFPLVFALYIKWLKGTSRVLGPLALALVWFVFLTPSYMTPPYLVLHLFILALYSTFWVLGGNGRRKRLKKAVWFNLLLLAFWLLLNLFWLLPFAFTLKEQLTVFRYTLPETIPTDLFTLNSVPVWEALRLRGYFGFTSSYKGNPLCPWFDPYKNNLFFDILSFVVPVLAFLGFFVKRKKERAALFFLFLTLVFIALAKGANPPFGAVNRFIFSLPPLATMFRTVYQRFTGYIALGLSVLVGYAFDCLFKTGLFKDMRARAGLFVTFVVLICGIYVLPIWNGRLFSQQGLIPSKRVKIPDYYFQAAGWLDEQGTDFNTLLLPFNRDGLVVNSWSGGENGYAGVEPLPLLSQGRFGYGDFGRGLGGELASGLISGQANDSRFLSPFNFKYVLVKNDTSWEYIRGNTTWIGNDQELVNDVVGRINGLAKVKSFGPLDLYKINDEYFTPHFYVPQSLVYFRSIPPTSVGGDRKEDSKGGYSFGRYWGFKVPSSETPFYSTGGLELFSDLVSLEDYDVRLKAYLLESGVAESIGEILVRGEVIKDGCSKDGLCYQLSITEEGEYTVMVGGTDTDGLEEGNLRRLDSGNEQPLVPSGEQRGDTWRSFGKIPLEVGEYFLRFRSPSAVNLLQKEDGEYSVPFEGPASEWEYNTKYKVSFDYQVGKGIKLSVGLLEKKIKDGKARLFMVPVGEAEGDGIFEETVTAKYGVEEVVLKIGTGSRGKPDAGKVRSVKVQRVFEPKILLKKVSGVGEKSEGVPRITFAKVNPTKYRVKVEGAKKPFALVFNETFHDGWRIYWGKNPLAADHFLANWYANAWYIKPEDVGGAKDFELVVEFWPQRLFYTGLWVSSLVLVSCFGYVSYSFIKGRRLNRKIGVR